MSAFAPSHAVLRCGAILPMQSSITLCRETTSREDEVALTNPCEPPARFALPVSCAATKEAAGLRKDLSVKHADAWLAACHR